MFEREVKCRSELRVNSVAANAAFKEGEDSRCIRGNLPHTDEIRILAVEGGWFHAEADDDSTAGLTNAEIESDEYFVGLRLVPWDFLIAPYGSVGATYVDSTLDATATSDDDQVVAFYARLGAAFTIGILRIGVDGRALFGSDVDLDTIESDLDNLQLTAFLGLGF